MPENEGIHYSKFTVTKVEFNGQRFPQSVTLESHYFPNQTKGNLSAVALEATLTKEESITLMRVLNDIATRVENEIRDNLNKV